jgi:ribosomal protein S6
MFLVDSAQAAADWDGTLAVIETILKRADADVVSMRKWGERRLAYEINHQTRGTYILCYFKANGQRIAGIEKDVQLSEKVMRVLILGTEKRPAKMLEADIAGVSAEAEEAAAEGRSAGEGAAKAVAAGEATPAAGGEAPEKQETPAVEAAPEGTAEMPAETPAAEAPVQEPAPASDEQATPVETPASEPQATAEAGSEEPEKL